MRTTSFARGAASRAALAAVIVVGIGAAVAPAAASAGGDANRAGCGANAEASPGFRAYLPDCRAYELVTPPFKGGSSVFTEPAAIASDGGRVIVGSSGAFDGVGNLWLQVDRNPDTAVYRMSRGGSSWESQALTPPATEYPVGAIQAVDAPGLEKTLWSLATGTSVFNEDLFMSAPAGGAPFARIGPGLAPEVAGEEVNQGSEELTLVGASEDLSHGVYSVTGSSQNAREQHHGHDNLWPGDTTESERPSLYEYRYSGATISEPTLVGVRNNGPLTSNVEAELISSCGTELGSGHSGSIYNAMSADGAGVFFTASACEGMPAVAEVYARLNASTTVPISEPTSADCEICNTTTEPNSAVFEGASRDGQRAFFLTAQSLLPGQEGANLYEYDFGRAQATPSHPDGRIALISEGSTNPEVQGVVRISEDGKTVYFVAKGALTGANGEGVSPTAGADNLYASETKEGGERHLAFVATLLTPAEQASLEPQEAEEAAAVAEKSEAAALKAFQEALAQGKSIGDAISIFTSVHINVEDELTGTFGPQGTINVDTGTWRQRDDRPAQATPDGRFLLFLSSADLTVDDISTVPQLFEYDAQSERITRVSITSEPSLNEDGNAHTFARSPSIPAPEFADVERPTAPGVGLAISEDGARIFFTSANQLNPIAKQRTTNVYEYRAGGTYLISDGQDTSEVQSASTVRLFGTTPSGDDVFFSTADSLVPQVGDSAMAVYDARQEGGFPGTSSHSGCTGEACRGPAQPSPVFGAPGSTTQAGGDNVPPSAGGKPTPPSRATRLAAALRRCRHERHRKRPRRLCETRARKTLAIGSKASKGTHRVSRTASKRGGATR